MNRKKTALALVLTGCLLILFLLFLPNRTSNSEYPGQTTHLPKADRLEIHLLGSEHVERSTNAFHIGLEDWNLPILKTEILEDARAEEIAALWRKIPFGLKYIGKCHNPPYGLIFYSDASPTLEMSVCWECDNFYFNGVGEKPCAFGFDGHSKKAQNLLKKLQAIIPIKNL